MGSGVRCSTWRKGVRIVLQLASGVCLGKAEGGHQKWCGWSDSNRQRGNPQRILSPPRMPISPQPHRAFTRQQQNSTQARRRCSERFAAKRSTSLANSFHTPRMRWETYFSDELTHHLLRHGYFRALTLRARSPDRRHDLPCSGRYGHHFVPARFAQWFCQLRRSRLCHAQCTRSTGPQLGKREVGIRHEQSCRKLASAYLALAHARCAALRLESLEPSPNECPADGRRCGSALFFSGASLAK